MFVKLPLAIISVTVDEHTFANSVPRISKFNLCDRVNCSAVSRYLKCAKWHIATFLTHNNAHFYRKYIKLLNCSFVLIRLNIFFITDSRQITNLILFVSCEILKLSFLWEFELALGLLLFVTNHKSDDS
ncbi:MAG: hypothetical protein COA78_06290 [Blastopirellula sp.]|nr:MAG: hypothetical protein COA78_06290 [Blastopirellula sp.]